VATNPTGTSAGEIVYLRVSELKLHSTAKDVPGMRSQEWEAFLEDVRFCGVREPLTVQKDGPVLDGRHRLRAAKECRLETVPARLVDLSKDEQVELIYRTALLRRHLNDDQRAMLAASWNAARTKLTRKARATKAGQAGGRGRPRTNNSSAAAASAELSPAGQDNDTKTRGLRAREEAAAWHGVSERKVRAAARLEREAPLVAEMVRSGSMTLAQARRTLAPPKNTTQPPSPVPTVPREESHLPGPTSGSEAEATAPTEEHRPEASALAEGAGPTKAEPDHEDSEDFLDNLLERRPLSEVINFLELVLAAARRRARQEEAA
jgi:hypothetical protein